MSGVCLVFIIFFFFFKQKTAYEMRISDWSSDVCSSDLRPPGHLLQVFESLGEDAAIAPKLAVDLHQVAGQLVGALVVLERQRRGDGQIGRASCRERVCQYV